jgi:hypothetical protein
VPPGWHQDLLVPVEPEDAERESYREAQRDRYLAAAEAVTQARSLLRLAYDKLDGAESFAVDDGDRRVAHSLRGAANSTLTHLDLFVELIVDGAKRHLY